MPTKQFSNYSDLLTFTRASKGHALRPVSYGDELVVNGDFSTDSDWTKTAGAVISGGKATITVTSGGYQEIYQPVSYVAGKIYRLTATITGASAVGGFRVVDNGTNLGGLKVADTSTGLTGSPQNISFIWVANANSNRIQIARNVSGDYSFTVDNISVKEVFFDQPDGTLTLFEHPNNVPRVEYDADGNRLGLLVEEQRVNQVTQSEDFGAGVWNSAAAGITVVRNDIAAPDGTMTADKLQEKATTDTHRRGFAISGANDKIFSFFAKAGERTKVRTWSFAGGNTQAATFDLSEGTVVTGSSGAKEGKIEYYGNGWYRCSSKIDGGQTTVVVGPMIDGVTGNNTGSYTGDGSSGVYVWGAQIEDNVSFPTSYIKSNSGSTTTRSADVASIPVADFGYNQSAGSFLIEATLQDFGGVSVPVMFSDGTSNERFYARVNNNPYHLSLVAISGGTTQANVDSNVDAVFGQTFVFAGAIKKDDFSVSVDGQTAVTDTSGSSPSGITKVNFGSDHANTLNMQGHIKSIQYYPRRLTNAQLQALTEPRSTPTLSLTFDGLESSYTENYIHG